MVPLLVTTVPLMEYPKVAIVIDLVIDPVQI
jgi:hypothetical protein